MKYRTLPAFLVDLYADVVTPPPTHGPIDPHRPIIVREPESEIEAIAALRTAGLDPQIIRVEES